MTNLIFLNQLKRSIKNINNFFLRFDSHIRLLLIPLILILICIIFGLINFKEQLDINQKQVIPLSNTYKMYEYPTLGTFINPDISAQAAAIYDPSSSVFLYTKNATLHFSMASTTKLMTALVALSYFKPNDILTVQRNSVEGTVLNLRRGEQLTFKSLLYAMLLNSANDAAYAIADNYPGGMSAFVAQMNIKAKQLHLVNTTFIDPAGLEDDNDFTTVTELARLASVALMQTTIAKVVNTKYFLISTVNNITSYQLQNLNQLLGYDGVIGMKTGTTEGAGQVLITAKQQSGHTFIIVVMESTDRYADTLTLLHLIDTNTQFIDPLELARQ